MPLTAERKQSIIAESRRTEQDTGSPEVQISLLTQRITDLTEHVRENKQDNHSRRGLVMMVARRNRLLKYLSRTDRDAYQATIKRLGLRK
jgi:small subunit ribosomal protein S15